jgi:hypothetical protein
MLIIIYPSDPMMPNHNLSKQTKKNHKTCKKQKCAASKNFASKFASKISGLAGQIFTSTKILIGTIWH